MCLFLQYFCSTVVVRHLVLWQHQGSFHDSTVAALYRVQYCCSTAPWCYCSTLVLLQHPGAIAAPWCYCSTEKEKKSRGTQDQEKSRKGRSLNRLGMAKLRTKRHTPVPRAPGKASRQGLIVVHR